MNKVKAPHFVLFSESTSSPDERLGPTRPQSPAPARYWHFVLRTEDGSVKVDACDEESGASDERLALLAVVRGLEAVPEPACVTLVTAHSSIRRGLRFGLDNWRDNQWQWERFGKMTPIKNFDLWQRVDRALQFHEIDCRPLRSDLSTDDLIRPVPRPPVAVRDDVTARLPERAAISAATPRGPSRYHAASQLLMGTLRRLFGWCGLCRRNPTLVIAAH